MRFSEAVSDLFSRSSGKEPGVDAAREALQELGNPEQSLSVILVGGTNGKGSTASMIDKMLRSQGFRVGLFRSPHVDTVRERIKVDGEMISRESFLKLYQKLEDSCRELSFFQFLTVMAYTFFRRQEVEYAVMEVGMGGRLDATNAINPELSVITGLGADHTEYLGEKPEEIARELCGIISDSVVIGGDNEELLSQARKASESLVVAEGLDTAGDRVVFEGKKIDTPSYSSFQAENLGTAVAALRELENVSQQTVASVEDLDLRARMEVVSENPLEIHDGAHNPHAVETVLGYLPDSFTCVFNASKTKDFESMIGLLEEKADYFYFTESDVKWASEDPEKLAQCCTASYQVIHHPVEALEAARDREGPVLVTGSMYLIGSL